ncbi:hypothetical protein C0992_000389 [Termitomyces sp. T32_za158]|nr:hypothetical protein C0992_000389 [Termitomyces sp. T32_za158]
MTVVELEVVVSVRSVVVDVADVVDVVDVDKESELVSGGGITGVVDDVELVVGIVAEVDKELNDEAELG